jgi:hypothetical protein
MRPPEPKLREAYTGNLRRSSFMATSKNRRGILFGRIYSVIIIWCFWICQEIKKLFSQAGKSCKFFNSDCLLSHAFIGAAYAQRHDIIF